MDFEHYNAVALSAHYYSGSASICARLLFSLLAFVLNMYRGVESSTYHGNCAVGAAIEEGDGVMLWWSIKS